MDISREIIEAKKGFHVWKKLYKGNKITNQDRILCLLECENELNKAVLMQLDDYIEKKYLQRIVLVINEKDRTNIKEYNCAEKVTVYRINDDEMNYLIRFLRVVNLMDCVIVVSDKPPFGNLNLIGVKDITLQQYIAGTYLWRTNATNDRK